MCRHQRPLENEVRLSDAQRTALRHIHEGFYELVSSGTHLTKLAEFGLIERGRDSRYVLTDTGRAALNQEMKPCPRGNDDCPVDCCAHLSAPPAAPSVAPSVASAPADVAEVQRWSWAQAEDGGMWEYDAGEYVKFADYDRDLKAAKNALDDYKRRFPEQACMDAARDKAKAEAERDALRDMLALVVAQSGHDGTITPALYERCASLAADVGKEGGT